MTDMKRLWLFWVVLATSPVRADIVPWGGGGGGATSPTATPAPTATPQATPAITANTLAKGAFLQNSAITDDGAGAIGWYPAAASPQAVTETYASATGTDHAGAALTTKLSGSTGSGLGGAWTIQNTNKAGTGSSANTYGPVLSLSPPNTGTSAPVNYIDLKNAITGGSPTFTATGSDSAIDITILPKGAGVLRVGGSTGLTDAQIYVGASGAIRFDASGAVAGRVEGGNGTGKGIKIYASNTPFFAIADSGAEIRASQDAKPTITSSGGTCGTSPSVTNGSSDTLGQFTVGSGTVSACTITFNHTWSVAPRCFLNNETQGATAGLRVSGTNTTTMTVTLSAANLNASDVIDYICMASTTN